MPASVFDAPAPSSDTSDYAADGTVDSDDSVSDQDEGTSMSRPLLNEVANGPSLKNKASTEHVKDAWDHEPLAGQYDRATDVAPRLLVCGWQGCRSKLGSFALLEKHLRKKHVEGIEPTPAANTSRGTRKFVCRYGSCANRWFATRDDLMVHVVDNHLEQLRLTCPVKACRRVNTTRSALRRHLHTVHANEPQFTAVLQNPAVTPQQANGGSFPTFPTLLIPVPPAATSSPPSSSSRFPTYIAFLPRLRPAPPNPERQKVVDDGNDFDPYFMEFFEEDEPLKPRHRLQLSRRPVQSSQNLEPVKRLEKVQLTPSHRLRRTQSVVSASETLPGPEESHELVFKITHRVRGTTLYLPRREMPPPPDLSKVSWREFKAPIGPELEAAATDVAPSSRAPSVATLAAPPSSRESSVEPPISETFRKRKISPPPSSPSAIGLHSLPQATSVEIAVTETDSQSTACSAALVPTVEPPLPPTIGFKALSTWRSGFEHAVETGAMEKDQDPFLPKPAKTGRKKERARKKGRPTKRVRLE